MKRFFLFLMVLMLLAGTAVAEGALPVVQDKLTLTVLKEVRDIDTLTPDNNAAVKKLEELTNVHAEYLDVVKQSDWNTKLSLTLASGELPDVIWSRGDFDFEEYGAVPAVGYPCGGADRPVYAQSESSSGSGSFCTDEFLCFRWPYLRHSQPADGLRCRPIQQPHVHQ